MHGSCMSAYRRRGKAFTDCCCYCVSLAPNFIRLFSSFAKGSQTPTPGWPSGLFGENCVFWVFRVGSVAVAGMMQELK